MSYRPDVIVIDFETALLTGEPSTEYYREDFRAISCAFAWTGADGTVRTKYREGEIAIGEELARIKHDGIPLVVHNLPFEYGVCSYRFPGTEGSVLIDTMRLVQVADNGGKAAHWEVKPQTYDDMLDAVESDEDEKPKQSSGLSLVSAASRWLSEDMQDHKAPFYALIRERTGCKQRQEGKNLNALTPDELEAYNVADAKVTLALYRTLLAKFAEDNYDWRLDHELYRGSARRISKAKGRGVVVDRTALVLYKQEVETELARIADNFRETFKREISELETEWFDAWCNELKSERGRQARRDSRQYPHFNVGSNKQLAALFVDKLGMQPKFTTETGQPSFKSAFLNQWGEGGELLKKRRKRLLVLKQCESLLALSEYDGKWHVDLKACGTTTGRFAGGRQ